MRHLILLSIAVRILFLETSCAQQHRDASQPRSISATYPIEVAFTDLSFSRPVDLQHSKDGTNRLFVVEQAGRILVFPNNQSTPASSMNVFLDIKSKVKSSGNEEGLLGLAFHPDYKNNGYFFVDYTTPTTIPNSVSETIIARYKVKANAPNEADPASETIFLRIPQPYSNHNGGQIQFGPDGYLYIAMGDGGSGGDPKGNGQNKSALLGKILRINVDTPSGNLNYSIPNDNPFKGNTQQYKEEIWTWGMRNPWRFSYDSVDHRWWCGDVGQNAFEEIDILEGGKNYGWKIMEGFACYSPSTGCDTTGLVKPIVDYGRSLGMSVTGGYVYRGKRVPELVGAYIYADFVTNRFWSLRYDGKKVTENSEILVQNVGGVSSFGVDAENELYICAFNGKIYRFVATSSGKIQLNLNQINFGKVKVGESSGKDLELTNVGNGALQISAITVTTTSGGDFTTNFTQPFTVQPGAKSIVQVTFLPKSSGASSANLNIQSNDPLAPSSVVQMNGEGANQTGIATSSKSSFALHQNFPNPLTISGNASTNISFEIGERSYVEIMILNPLGMLIAKPIASFFERGMYSVQFEPSSLPAGQYFYKMIAGNFSDVKRMFVVR